MNKVKLRATNERDLLKEDIDIDIEKIIKELSEQCYKQLQIYPSNIENTDFNKSIINLRLAKSELKHNDRMSIINYEPVDMHRNNRCIVQQRCNRRRQQHHRPQEKLQDPFHKRNVSEHRPMAVSHATLSASTSISKSRIFCQPSIGECQPMKRAPSKHRLQQFDTAQHPLWDTPEELRTSCPSAFSNRSVLDRTLSEMGETSRYERSVWLDDCELPW